MSEKMKQEASVDKHGLSRKQLRKWKSLDLLKGLDAYAQYKIVIIIKLCYVKGTLVDQGNVDEGHGRRNIYHANTNEGNINQGKMDLMAWTR